MSLLQIKNALETRLDAMSPKLPTSWENAAFTIPADGSPFQRVNLLPAPPENPTLGARFYRERGLMQVTLNYPNVGGARSAISKAEAIRDWFPLGASYSKDGVIVNIPNTPTIGPGRPVDGRYLIPISIPYYADILS